jgi:hypothetical protein
MAHSGEGSYVDGIYVPTAKAAYETSMAVSLLSVDDLEYFDRHKYEENFTIEDRKFYDNLLHIDIDVNENDIIIHNNREYEVVEVLDRSDRGFKVYYGKYQK